MSTSVKESELFQISYEDLFEDSVLAFPIFFRVAGQMVLYKPKGAPFTKADLDRIQKNSISAMYVPKTYEQTYAIYYDKYVSKIVSDTKMPTEKKSKYLIKNAGFVVKDIFSDPENPKNFLQAQSLVKNFVSYIKQGLAAFHSIINLSIHDYYTYTHSIGVMTYTISLASQIGITSRETLEYIGMAGLLHDIGKSKIPFEIINKAGPLNDKEWDVMRKHACYSFEIASQYEKMPEMTLKAIQQHHENPNGTGYPNGIQGLELHLFAKMVAVSDIYSAITTDRSYSKGKSSFEALKIMKSIADQGNIDKMLFQNFVVMLKS